eukprot:g570.t1
MLPVTPIEKVEISSNQRDLTRSGKIYVNRHGSVSDLIGDNTKVHVSRRGSVDVLIGSPPPGLAGDVPKIEPKVHVWRPSSSAIGKNDGKGRDRTSDDGNLSWHGHRMLVRPKSIASLDATAKSAVDKMFAKIGKKTRTPGRTTTQDESETISIPRDTRNTTLQKTTSSQTKSTTLKDRSTPVSVVTKKKQISTKNASTSTHVPKRSANETSNTERRQNPKRMRTASKSKETSAIGPRARTKKIPPPSPSLVAIQHADYYDLNVEDKATPGSGTLLDKPLPQDMLTREDGISYDQRITAAQRRRDELLRTRARLEALRQKSAAASVRRNDGGERYNDPSTVMERVRTRVNHRRKHVKVDSIRKESQSTSPSPVANMTTTTTKKKVRAEIEERPRWRGDVERRRVVRTPVSGVLPGSQGQNSSSPSSESVMTLLPPPSTCSMLSDRYDESDEALVAAVGKFCELLPDGISGGRLLAALKRVDSDRDDAVAVREIFQALKTLSSSFSDTLSVGRVAAVVRNMERAASASDGGEEPGAMGLVNIYALSQMVDRHVCAERRRRESTSSSSSSPVSRTTHFAPQSRSAGGKRHLDNLSSDGVSSLMTSPTSSTAIRRHRPRESDVPDFQEIRRRVREALEAYLRKRHATDVLSGYTVSRAFMGLNTNNDGCISLPEFERLNERLGLRLSQHEILTLWQGVDRDRNGVVSYREFALLLHDDAEDRALADEHLHRLAKEPHAAQRDHLVNQFGGMVVVSNDDDNDGGLSKGRKHIRSYERSHPNSTPQVFDWNYSGRRSRENRRRASSTDDKQYERGATPGTFASQTVKKDPLPSTVRAAIHSRDIELLSRALLKLPADVAQRAMIEARSAGLWKEEERDETQGKNSPAADQRRNATKIEISPPTVEKTETRPLESSSSAPARSDAAGSEYIRWSLANAARCEVGLRDRQILEKISTKLSMRSSRIRDALKYYLGNPRSISMHPNDFRRALDRMGVFVTDAEFSRLVSRLTRPNSDTLDYTILSRLIAANDFGGAGPDPLPNASSCARSTTPRSEMRVVAPWDK